MTDKEVALEIILRNEKVIRDRLIEEGYMFDDELNEGSIASSVARELPTCIKEYFQLDEDEYIIREEITKITRSDGVFYFSRCEKDLIEVREIAKEHFES